jgi:hypothetical protein
MDSAALRAGKRRQTPERAITLPGPAASAGRWSIRFEQIRRPAAMCIALLVIASDPALTTTKICGILQIDSRRNRSPATILPMAQHSGSVLP